MATLPSHPFPLRIPEDHLQRFFLPLYDRAVRCDLAVFCQHDMNLTDALAGVARLSRNGGRMRLLLVATGPSEFGESVEDLIPVDFFEEESDERLGTVGWMLAHRHLEARVVVPRQRIATAPTEGVVTDARGHRLAWSGDLTFASWDRPLIGVPASLDHLRAVEERFESLWNGSTPGWDLHELPEGLRDTFLGERPDEAPYYDSLEEVDEYDDEYDAPRPEVSRPDAPPIDENLVFRFLREAPFLPGARDLGTATSAVRPWPHQRRVVRRVVERFPQSFLFADEVGLGKTIEAALALRQLWISGRVRRALILVPASVLRQWQEELYEKAGLHVPRFTGDALVDVHGKGLALPKRGQRREVWNEHPLLLATTQLARRRKRRDQILAAEPWDLVIVDEAHHARRRDARPDRYRPNRLLELLAGGGGRPGLKDRARAVHLLSATPMQVHPVELWDLLRVLGMGGRWGAHPEPFVDFFAELRRPPEERDQAFVQGMLDAEGGRSPLVTYVHRHTRRLLDKYRMQGLVDTTVPERRPQNVWISLKDDERALYEKIEQYLVEFYRRYEEQRRGLGFVMTVYRRRLTSSFAAIRRSLERRLEHLQEGMAQRRDVLDFEEFEDAESDVEAVVPDTDAASDERRELMRSEAAYLEEYLAELRALGPDSKLERLLADLRQILSKKKLSTVLIFTQYTDTMDHLRDQLAEVYGERVACYSGRGGERLRDGAWTTCSKEDLKEAFRSGEKIQLLLATEAASEGLNLQTCGVLVNFDMPWNPMRVEQRIGRIDRIGQVHREIRVLNYFYDDTVEAVIYQRLGERIRWFEAVLGEMQPILHRVGETITSLAMLGRGERQRRLEEELTSIRMDLDQQSQQRSDFLALESSEDWTPEEADEVPVTLQELEEALARSETLGPFFDEVEEIPGVYHVRPPEAAAGEGVFVTFDPEVFDRHPSTVQFLTYGHPLLDDLLALSDGGSVSEKPRGLGVYRSEHPAPLTLLFRPTATGAVPIANLAELRYTLADRRGIWPVPAEGEATAVFRAERRRLADAYARAAERRRRGAWQALVEAAGEVLRRSALVLLAQGRSPSLFEDDAAPRFTSFDDAVVELGERGTPFRELLDIVRGEGREPAVGAELTEDPYFKKVSGRPEEELQRKGKALFTEAREVLRQVELFHQAHASTVVPEDGKKSGKPTIERTYLLLANDTIGDLPDEDEEFLNGLPFPIVDDEDLVPFQNAVPYYEDLGDALRRFTDELDEFGAIQEDEEYNPHEYLWVVPTGRTGVDRGLFVAPLECRAMNLRIAEGSYCLFRLVNERKRPVQEGRVVAVSHPEIEDPDLGDGVAVRIYESEISPEGDGWTRRVILRPASRDLAYDPLVLEADDDLRILAELIEIIG